MKKRMLMTLGSFLILSLICFAGTAVAALIDMGDGTIYDDVNNQYWIQDLNMFESRSTENIVLYYNDQVEAIKALSESEEYGSYGDWRMATAADIANLYSYTIAEIGEAFTPVDIGERYWPSDTYLGTGEYYNGRYDESSDGEHRQTYIYIERDTQGSITFTKRYTKTVADSAWGANLGAWAVVDASAVPVPSALVLFWAGLTLLAGKNRRKNT